MKKKHFYTAVILLSFLAVGIQPTLATIYLTKTGWSDPTVGTWVLGSLTATLTTNVTETIMISNPWFDGIGEGDRITLDGGGNTISGVASGEGVDFVDSFYITVQNLNVSGCGAGISLRFSSNCTISNNTISTCNYGIWLAGSNHNLVIGNTADQSLEAGIWLQQNASNNNITGNTTENSVNGYGIYAQNCTNNNDLANNTIKNNEVGIGLFNCSNFNSSITGNNVSSNTLFGIHLLSSSNNTLAGNTVSNNNQGIYLVGSDDNTLTNNTTSSNSSNGIGLRNSSENILSNNTTSNNNYGVRIWAYATESSINNQIYNNNFIDNTTHANVFAQEGGIIDNNLFNLDPPIGGNFWSDWLSSDPYVFNGVVDNSPWTVQNGWLPVAKAGADQTVECACQTPKGTQVTLNGSGSTGASIYMWTGPFLESPASGSNPTVTLEPGCLSDYVINLVVNNGQYDSEPDTVTITVVDTTPPDVIPPGDVTIEAMGPDPVPVDDERIQAFLAGVSVSDNCDPEPDINDDAPSEFPTGDTIVTFVATDTSDNSSTCQSTVTVAEAAESSLRIIPSIINRDGILQKILAVIRFPEGTAKEDIDIGQLLVLYPGDSLVGIEAINQRIVTWYRWGTLRVSVFASFSKDEVTAGVPENGPAELMVIGRFTDGQYFYGLDNVWICSWNW